MRDQPSSISIWIASLGYMQEQGLGVASRAFWMRGFSKGIFTLGNQ
jgi:hypothetical protein